MDMTRDNRTSHQCTDDLMAKIVTEFAEFDAKGTEIRRCNLEECELADLIGECVPMNTLPFMTWFPMGEASIQSSEIENVCTFPFKFVLK